MIFAHLFIYLQKMRFSALRGGTEQAVRRGGVCEARRRGHCGADGRDSGEGPTDERKRVRPAKNRMCTSLLDGG